MTSRERVQRAIHFLGPIMCPIICLTGGKTISSGSGWAVRQTGNPGRRCPLDASVKSMPGEITWETMGQGRISAGGGLAIWPISPGRRTMFSQISITRHISSPRARR